MLNLFSDMAKESQTSKYFHIVKAKRMKDPGKALKYMSVINGSTNVSGKTLSLPSV